MKNYLAGLALLLLCLAGASAANARSGYPPPLHYESVSDTDTVALDVIDFSAVLDSLNTSDSVAYNCLIGFIINDSNFSSKSSKKNYTVYFGDVLDTLVAECDTCIGDSLATLLEESTLIKVNASFNTVFDLVSREYVLDVNQIESASVLELKLEEKRFRNSLNGAELLDLNFNSEYFLVPRLNGTYTLSVDDILVIDIDVNK